MSTLITKDMEEPKEYGPYLVTNPDNANEYPCLLIHDEKDTIGHSWIGDDTWYRWSTVKHQYDGYSIESLTDHAADIRRKALVFTDEECDVFTTEVDKAEQWVTPYAIREGLKAVTEFRERVS